MSNVFSFYGASDDLVEVDGPDGPDEFNHYHGAWVGTLRAPNGVSVEVIGHYGANGAGDCWSFGLSLPQDGDALPAWRYDFLPAPEITYSVRLVVEAPDGTVLEAAS